MTAATNVVWNGLAIFVFTAVVCLFYLAIVNQDENFANMWSLLRGSSSANTSYQAADLKSMNPDVTLDELEIALGKAANPNKTVIITTLNGAWAEQNSMVDLFLESFGIGEGTQVLLRNLLLVAVDEKAFNRCLAIHPHCYSMKTDGIDFSAEKIYMTEDYLKLMWRRLRFFGEVLERGYNFLFSDADIMWFRDPFKRFEPNADMEIASDWYNGKPEDLKNSPNAGFMYVRSNNRTIGFFRFWYSSRQAYPGRNEQDVLNVLKSKGSFATWGLKFLFLDTKYFGGFCHRSQDLNSVYTMHANCCKGLKAKLVDLRNTLIDWFTYRHGQSAEVHWTPPNACMHSWKT